MPTQQFSPELQAELAQSLEAYVSTKGAGAEEERLHAAMNRVCSEAHAAAMPLDEMVNALREAYRAITVEQRDEVMRGAYDRLFTGCVQAYYEEQQRRKH